MNPLEIKKVLLEIQKVQTAKMEMEVRIAEREDEIIRLKWNMDNQDKRVEELKAQLVAAGVTPPG